MRVLPEPIEVESDRRPADGATPNDPERAGWHFQTLSSEERKRLRDEVARACEPVAPNWPMKTFSYRNPLRGWEHLPFDEAIREAKHLLGGNGYISNEEHRQLYREGRITDDAIKRALQRVEPSIGVPTITAGKRLITSSDVLRLHLLFGFDALDPALLTWQLSAGGSTTRFRHDLPGICSFIGEFLVLLGASEVSFVMVLLAMGGIVLAASYMLWMLQRVALGQPATRTASLLSDLTVRETVTLVPLALIVLWICVYPAPMMEMINASVANLVPASK